MSSLVNPSLAMFEQFAAVARALGHPHRLVLLQLLGQGETGVEVLAGRAGITIANASQHLQRLRRAGLVSNRKDGQRVLYRLSDKAVLNLLAALRKISEHNLADARALIQSYFRERDALEPVSRKELLRRIREKRVTVLDVRLPEEFAAGHLPSAINIPLVELRRRLRELPPATDVVAYCRGAYCFLSYEAVAELRKQGHKVWRLEDGFPEWKAAGLPVEACGESGANDRVQRKTESFSPPRMTRLIRLPAAPGSRGF
jgi:rhodanese-related sulfurtransferase/DNA-binding transcriptional ArsR family regulator